MIRIRVRIRVRVRVRLISETATQSNRWDT